jgi:uncharacterized protein DUF4232
MVVERPWNGGKMQLRNRRLLIGVGVASATAAIAVPMGVFATGIVSAGTNIPVAVPTTVPAPLHAASGAGSSGTANAAAQSPSTSPTTVPPASSGAAETPATAPPSATVLPMNTLTHQAAPAVTIPDNQCTAADLSAALTSVGPYEGQGTGQYIISISSSVSCAISGYPSLQFTGQSGTVQDGGTVGNPDPAGPVAVGGGDTASFLLQFSDRGACTLASALAIGLPGGAPSIPVGLDSQIASGWQACGTTAVSPFEQGNSAGRYA